MSVALFNSQTRIVDQQGRPTRPLMMALQTIFGPTATGLAGRVGTLETSVSAQAVSISANASAIAALQVRMLDAEVESLWVSPWL